MVSALKRFFAITGLAAAAALAGSDAGRAQGGLLEVYVAFLGPADHYNSRGARLTEPWQIIRQDRANFHRFGIRDPGDQGDRFFASANNRERMERMILNGYIDPSAAWRIVNENVWIRVEIYPNSVNVTVN
ncbi:hypothetical protein [Polymorphum gilvum]|uniref:Hypothetical conserved protein n=1 Tax=Polymorphum gilvum (strain LMG 25793 / CGMCC 1.9160 / SL003B-26A1) TaxID=991905 RepID=F2J479_POLGS|nr:hypothetical protein [Polymorphum gilvum]ADZ70005.1 Hypothetical conserved protein [Polymorphum gilvum SL003B-26A1]